MKKYGLYIMVALMLCMMCNQKAEAAKDKKIKSIAFKRYQNTLTIEKGESLELKVKITPKKATNRNLKWKSSKKKIVSVDSKGVIKGRKKGNSIITVQTTDGTKLKLKLKVTVGTKIDSIAFSNTQELTELVLGERIRLQTEILPVDASNKTLVWTSSDESIATVDSKGNVTPKANGVVKITAMTTDGTYKKISITLPVVTKMKSLAISLKAKSAYCTALNQYAVYMKKGTKFSMDYEIKPETTSNKTLKWMSSNPLVATVLPDGKVQALGVGVTVITAQATDGSEKKDTFTVYVGALNKQDCNFVAHRGWSEKAPDNSLASISLALQSEFDYVEFDIWKTIDDQFVVSHDESLIDSCGVDVKVTELTLLQAMSYKIIYGKNSDVYLNEYIPSLEQILALAKDYPDKHLNIELKHVMSQEVLQNLLDLLIVYEMQDRVSILAFDQENIKTLRLLTASQKDVLSMQYLVNVPNDEVMQFCMDYNVGLGVKYNAISKSQIEILHQNGLMVNVWGVPNFYTVCYMVNNMNVDAITTDYMFFE